MKLQDLLLRSLREGSAKEGSPTHYRIRQCIDSLDAYAASGAGVDPLDALTPGWADDFVAFLTRGAEGRKPLSLTTALERKKRLRTVLRTAIQRGELPNIPVFPEPDDDREYEFPRLAPPPLPNLPAAEAAKLLIACAKELAMSQESKVKCQECHPDSAEPKVALLRSFISRAELEALLLARTGQAPLPDASLPAIEQRILEAFSLTPVWYCIKCRGSMHYKDGRRHRTRKTSGSLLQTYLAANIDGVEYYAPQDPVVTDRKGVKVVKNNRVLDELLFFRATRPQADAINRMLLAKRYGVIFHRREGESLQYCEIAERDLRRLRDFLGVKDAKRFPLLDFRNIVGKRVRVIAGIYEGYDGEVTRVAGADCFYVRIQGICAVATYAVDPDYLELLPL